MSKDFSKKQIVHCGFFSRYFVKLYFKHVILTCFIIITTFELSTTKAFSKVENIFDPIRLTHKINEKTLVLVFLLKVKSISRARATQNISQIFKNIFYGATGGRSSVVSLFIR